MSENESEVKIDDNKFETGADGEDTRAILTNNESNVNNNYSVNSTESENRNESDQEKQIERLEKNVSLSSVKLTNSANFKPTLPNVLSNYGLQEETKPKQSKKRKKKKKLKFFNEDEDRELMRQKERDDERHLQVVDDVEKLYKYMYSEYMNKLQSHVVKQRQEIQKKSAIIENRMKEQMEKEKREKSLAKNRRMQRHNVTDNTDFLKNITKTDLGKIVQLMDKMMKEGKLRTRTDLDDFWEKIQRPDVFRSYFKVPKVNDSYESLTDITRSVDRSQESGMDDVFENKQTLDMARALSQITENSKESSRPGTTSEWAVTQQIKHQHTGMDGAYSRRASASHVAKQAATDLDKRCPRLEMPKLSCFVMDLSKKGPDAEELQHKAQLRAREYQRKVYVKKLQKMHQMAMAHTAAANRILASHADELSLALEGSNLHDVFLQVSPEPDLENIRDAYTGEPIFFTEASGDYRETSERYGEPSGDYHERGSADFSIEKRSVESAGTTVSRKSKSSTSSKYRTPMKSLSRSTTSSPKLPHIPLTLNEMQNNSKIMEARCLSSNWRNYLNVGKSIFAPS